jgi:hypothetical protein
MKPGQNRTASWSLWSHLQPILLAPQLWILWSLAAFCGGPAEQTDRRYLVIVPASASTEIEPLQIQLE